MNTNKSIKDSINNYLKAKSQDIDILSTGFPQMDERLRHNGLPSDRLIYLIGKSGVGKTTHVLNWIYRLLKLGHKIYFGEYEMDWLTVVDILLAIHLDITMKEVDAQVSFVEDANSELNIESLNLHNLYIDDRSQSVEQINETLGRIKPQWVFIDHLHLISMPERDSAIFDKTTSISRAFRMFKREHNTRIISLVQLNRSSQNEGDKPPFMTDMKGSSALEEDADIIYALYRPDIKDDSKDPEIKMIDRKNRLPGSKKGTMTWTYTVGGAKIVARSERESDE